MLAPFIEVILILLDFVWWLIIASVVVSWLVAFGVLNTRNDVDVVLNCPTLHLYARVFAAFPDPKMYSKTEPPSDSK